MMKLGFTLNNENGWPPFDIEHLWVEELGRNYRIKNTPFFVRDIAFDDEIQSRVDRYGYVKEWKVIKRSGFSTAWIVVSSGNYTSQLIEALNNARCQTETGALEGYIAVGVPPTVKIEIFDRIISQQLASGALQLAFGSFQHS